MNRDAKNYRTGFDDELIPIKSIEPLKSPDTDELCRQMEHVGLGGSAVGDGVKILTEMFTDKNMFTVLTLSGAMTPAGNRRPETPYLTLYSGFPKLSFRPHL